MARVARPFKEFAARVRFHCKVNFAPEGKGHHALPDNVGKRGVQVLAQVGAVSLNAGRMKSAQRAAMAANGIDLGVGSAAELQASTDIMKEIDMATIEANAMRSAFGYRSQAMNFENEALAKRATAGAISPFGSMASSLLGSAGSVAGSWYSLNNSGNLKGTIFELKK